MVWFQTVPCVVMSVLDVFGQNLRNLTALRGSQVHVAEELDINRIQFGRYLRSESFPKPNILKRICDYFDVDARVLTDLLTPAQLESIAAAGGRVASMSTNPSIMNEAISYCVPDQGYFNKTDDLPDGLYQYWRRAHGRPDCAGKFLLKIFTHNNARVIRGFDARASYFGSAPYHGPAREFRGMLLKQRVGYAIVCFHREPSRVVSIDYLEPVDSVIGTFAAGFAMVARAALPAGHRVSKSALLRIDGGWPDVMRFARLPFFVEWEDVPDAIRPFIYPGEERF